MEQSLGESNCPAPCVYYYHPYDPYSRGSIAFTCASAISNAIFTQIYSATVEHNPQTDLLPAFERLNNIRSTAGNVRFDLVDFQSNPPYETETRDDDTFAKRISPFWLARLLVASKGVFNITK